METFFKNFFKDLSLISIVFFYFSLNSFFQVTLHCISSKDLGNNLDDKEIYKFIICTAHIMEEINLRNCRWQTQIAYGAMNANHLLILFYNAY